MSTGTLERPGMETVFDAAAEPVRRRLELCRRDLLDPLQRERPVAAIGARRGLANAAHFNRLFRAVYGLPPAQYRDHHG